MSKRIKPQQQQPYSITVASGDNWRIAFDRSVRDFAAYVGGELIGFAKSQSQAQSAIDAHRSEAK